MSHLALLTQVVGNQLAFVDGIAFDPFFRGLLSVLAAVIVLIGGTYLVIATDVGTRMGLLIAASALFGWLFLMGVFWTVYGIGWKGESPTWHLVEINVDDAQDADDGVLFSEVEEVASLTESSGPGLPVGGLGSAGFDADLVLDRIDDPEARDRAAGLLASAATVGDIADQDLAQDAALVASRELDLEGWRYLVTSDGIRGEAQASVDAFLVEEGVFGTGEFLSSQFGAFTIDGKPVLKEDANVIERITHTINETVFNPTFDSELIVVQVQGTTDQPTLPGQAPPVATVDPDAPVISVVMERDRGGPFPAYFSGLRFTPAMFAIFSGLVFAALTWNMHVRDQREAAVRAAA